MNGKHKFSIKDMVYIGMLASMCVIATSMKIPLGTGSMVHLGTAFIFTSAIIFGGVYAGLSAAIGSALFDLIMGFSPYTLWSFIIKGGAGLIAGTVAKGFWPDSKAMNAGHWSLRAVVGCILAAAWTLGGYIIAWWMVTGSLIIAFHNIPASLMTSGIGMIIALLLSPKLRNVLRR